MTCSEDGLDLSVSRRTRSRKSAARRSSVDMAMAIAMKPGFAIKKRRSSDGRNAPVRNMDCSLSGQCVTSKNENFLKCCAATLPAYYT